MKTVEIEELTGSHKLSGVQLGEIEVEEFFGFDVAVAVHFILDGTTYTAVENPSDGYRSMLDKIFVNEDADVINRFEPVDVVIHMRTDGKHGYTDEVLEFIDARNGKVVLEVGTQDVDDYYPVFVSNWYPENLSVNEGRLK